MSPSISQLLGIQQQHVVMFTIEISNPSIYQLATSPANSNFYLTVGFLFLKLVELSIFLASMNSVTFILDACKASFVRYLQVLLNFEKRDPAVKLA